MASKNHCVAEPDQSPPPHVVQEPPTNDQTAELDYDFVEQPNQDYFCPVSLELLVEPLQTSCCGHHISQQAANRLIRDRKPCPMCKEDNFATHEDKFFKRNCINKLKVYCSHKKSGCEWTGELGDLNHHITACPKRPWKCQYCDHESIYETGPTDHTPNCANYRLPCPNQCEIGTVPRCQADSHLLECPLQLVECEFAGTGCDVKVPRRDLAGHTTENAQHHLMTATLLNLRLTRELHQKMEEKDQQIIELKQQMTEQETKMITKNDLDTKFQQQTKDLDTKRQQQTKELDTKLQQQTKNLDTKLQQQTKDLDTKLQQQTKDIDTKLQQQTRELDTKLQQQTRELDTKLQQQTKDKLQQQTKDLDTKRQQPTKDLDTKLQQQTKDIDTKLQQQTKDLDTKLQQQTKVLDTKLQQQTKDIDTKLQQQTRELDTKLQQQSKDKLQQQTKDLDTKSQQPTKERLQQQTKDLETKLQQQIKDMGTKPQQHLETSIQLSTYTCHTHTLTGFNQYQARGNTGSWCSEPFYNCHGGYKFQLNIDTNGYGEAQGTHLTAHLCLISGDYDTKLHWPLKLTVILDMLNQEEDHGQHSVTTAIEFKQVTIIPNYECIGSTDKFYPLARLKEKNYLRNNKIKFRLWLKVM